MTQAEADGIDRARWPGTMVADGQRPLRTQPVVEPDTSLLQAWDTMSRDQLKHLPVVSGGMLHGILSRRRLERWLQTRPDLSM